MAEHLKDDREHGGIPLPPFFLKIFKLPLDKFASAIYNVNIKFASANNRKEEIKCRHLKKGRN